MEEYFSNLNEETKEYLKILSPEFPKWLLEYIDTKEMLRLDGVSQSCGTQYTKIYNDKYFYSVLSHSIGVALIVWNFTHDKKQTLAGLFHDIATPTFNHCIDFMNGDSEIQESTENRTERIIKESKVIMNLLNRDNIKLEEVSNYHIYPIADNKMPNLSADRLEYTLSGGLYQIRIFDIEKIKEIYSNIVLLKNEQGIEELGFKDKEICEKFMNNISTLWSRWCEDEDKLCMQFIADLIKSMIKEGYITIDDLYTLSEKEVINLIENCEDKSIKNAFKNYQISTKETTYKNDTNKTNIYCTSVKGKKRYINPLVNNKGRIKDISPLVENEINKLLNMKTHKYIGFNFNI